MSLNILRARATNFCIGVPCQCKEHYSFFTFQTTEKLFAFLDEVVQCQAEVSEFVKTMNSFPPIALLTWGDDIDEMNVICIPMIDSTKKPRKYTITTESDLFPVYDDVGSGQFSAFSIKKHFTILKTVDADSILRKCQDFVVQHISNDVSNGDTTKILDNNDQ